MSCDLVLMSHVISIHVYHSHSDLLFLSSSSFMLKERILWFFFCFLFTDLLYSALQILISNTCIGLIRVWYSGYISRGTFSLVSQIYVIHKQPHKSQFQLDQMKSSMSPCGSNSVEAQKNSTIFQYFKRADGIVPDHKTNKVPPLQFVKVKCRLWVRSMKM